MAERLASRRPGVWFTFQEVRGKLWTDLENYYSWDGTADLLLGIAATSLLANTSLDQDIYDWYKDDVDGRVGADAVAAWRRFGDGRYIIPATVAVAMVGRKWDHTACGSAASEFGCRATRAYCLGAPTLLFLQYTLGGARPEESERGSRWAPFEEAHGVSGHAFVGAVPFIAAATMTDDPYLKGALYAVSLLPAWTRLEHGGHYPSQIWMGWWIAYLACRAADRTDDQYDNLIFTPVTTPEMVGVGAIYQW